MNLEKFSNPSPDAIPTFNPREESGQIESNEPFLRHTQMENLELRRGQQYGQLKAAVSDIPEGTSQRAEADGILSKFSERIGRQTRALVTILALLSPLTVSGEVLGNHTEHTNSTEIQIDYSETAARSLESLSQKVWSDNHETQYVLYGNEGNERNVIKSEGDAWSNEVTVTPQGQMIMDREIHNMQENDQGDIKNHRLIIQHNHPAPLAGKYYKLTGDTLDQMESGEIRSIVAPPSITDLFSYNNLVHGPDILGQVQEPSGTWTFQTDQENPVTKIVKESKNMKYSFPSENNSEQQETKTYEIDNRVRYIVGAEMNRVEYEVQIKFGFSYSETFLGLMKTAENMRSLSSRGEDVSEYITEYIDLAAKLGINIEYSPRVSPTN